ncbi:MAG: helix-turn-helix domain-containing protein [Tissierellia bacterium]|nr:helix-turn-helix domain-containing protein [Tissierellia bacterium]
MGNKKNIFHGRNKKYIDLHDIYELIEMGLDKEEISKELGVSQKYINHIIKDYYEDY